MDEDMKKRARELYLRLPRIPTAERVILTDPKDESGNRGNGRAVYLHCGIVNGERYVWVSDVEGLSDALNGIMERGLITRKDLLLTTEGGLRKLIRLDCLEPVVKELSQRADFQMWNYRTAILKAILREAWTQFRDVPVSSLTSSEVEQGWIDWEARKEIMRGITKSKKDAESDKEQKLRDEIEQRLRWRIEYEFKNRKRTVEELVDEIQSMGWEVTLKRKQA